MTPLDLAMKAGRELDALVAEKVMGWTDVSTEIRKVPDGSTWFVPHGRPPEGEYSPSNDHYEMLRGYSTDIAAAWEVVEKMHADSFDASLDDSFGKWTVSFRRYFVYENGLRYYKTRLPLAFGESDTVPLAICLAALKAVEAA